MPRGVPKMRNPELNGEGDKGAEFGSGLPEAPPERRLYVQRGFAIRPRTGGGRIPVLLAVTTGGGLQAAADKFLLRRDEILSGREYTFEAMQEPEDLGAVAFKDARTHFWIGHGCSTWNEKHVLEQLRLARSYT